MRGDSLRDFYAKTLAVLGLGLLAAAGAIVDYWPVSGALPTVPAVAGLRDARVMAAPALPSEAPAPLVIRASYQAPPESRVSSRPFARSFRAVQFAEPVVEADPVPPVPAFDLTRVEPAWSPAFAPVELDLEGPPPSPIEMNASPVRPLLTGAVSALRKTHASIREAFRGMVGRIRKASPFFDGAAVPSFR